MPLERGDWWRRERERERERRERPADALERRVVVRSTGSSVRRAKTDGDPRRTMESTVLLVALVVRWTIALQPHSGSCAAHAAQGAHAAILRTGMGATSDGEKARAHTGRHRPGEAAHVRRL